MSFLNWAKQCFQYFSADYILLIHQEAIKLCIVVIDAQQLTVGHYGSEEETKNRTQLKQTI